MKKLIVFVILILSVITVLAQSAPPKLKGLKDGIENPNCDQKSETIYETWYLVDGMYMMFYEQTPVGYKHLIRDAAVVLDANDRNWNDADSHDDLIPKYAKGITDYENMHLALFVGDAELKRIWIINNQVFAILCNSDAYGIGITTRDE